MHTARVWKALIKNDIVLTIGEVRFKSYVHVYIHESYNLFLCIYFLKFFTVSGFTYMHMVALR